MQILNQPIDIIIDMLFFLKPDHFQTWNRPQPFFILLCRKITSRIIFFEIIFEFYLNGQFICTSKKNKTHGTNDHFGYAYMQRGWCRNAIENFLEKKKDWAMTFSERHGGLTRLGAIMSYSTAPNFFPKYDIP